MLSNIIRVFPRRTAYTPIDDYSFIGDPPLFRPVADTVHISVSFTWDIQAGYRLQAAWSQYYDNVVIGGPAINSESDICQPGLYIKPGIVFTSRGCNNRCSFCLVPHREGPLREVEYYPGNIIQDNNLLQCSHRHIEGVFTMLRQKRNIVFASGLESRLLSDHVADMLRSCRISQLFLACDNKADIKPLKVAVKKLHGFDRNKLRCYVMIGYNGETLSEAEERLREVWNAGCLPFAQLYQPPDKYIHYSQPWRDMARAFSRPAITKMLCRTS